MVDGLHGDHGPAMPPVGAAGEPEYGHVIIPRPASMALHAQALICRLEPATPTLVETLIL